MVQYELMIQAFLIFISLFILMPSIGAQEASVPQQETAVPAASQAAALPKAPFPKKPAPPPPDELVIADFDTGDKPNNINGDFGTWDKDPNDETQFAHMTFEPEDALGDKTGYSVRIEYDVDSPNPAYNGLWMNLNMQNATPYRFLNFYLKGDRETNFTRQLKIELKDRAHLSSPYILTGVTDQWKKFTLPLKKFSKLRDWTGLAEFVLVFDDLNANPKTGAIYLDQVTLTKVKDNLSPKKK